MATYAIVQTGGKQYRVQTGDTIRVEALPNQVGETVELDEVLLVFEHDQVTLGSPTVPGATVMAEVLENGRGKKIVVFKYKAKTRYQRRTGHRQAYTELKVTGISL